MLTDTPADTAAGVRLLGPIDVVTGGVVRAVPGARRKAVLAALAMHAGDTVHTERLIDIVWGQTPPATAANTLQRHISTLRRVLGTDIPVRTRSFGYRLDIPPDSIDAVHADRLIRHTTDNGGGPIPRLRQALSLWRGHALADIATLPWFREQAERLEDLRLDGVTKLIDLRLRRGEDSELVPELQNLIDQHPLREEFHRQLMLALYHSDRQIDALAVFRRLRRLLSEELGIEPGTALRDLEVAILRQDPNPHNVRQVRGLATVSVRVPAQLPLATAFFHGREAELAELDRLRARRDQPLSVAICAVAGTAGIGKTTLAVHWAHSVAAEYPDGQLYVNLRGYDPSGQAKDPADVLCGFLAALGVPVDRIPTGPDELAALYRSMLARKRVLVLLDNARNAEQVRPLLPGSPGCLVVVTSRNQLASLIAAEGAHPVYVGLPSAVEARRIVAQRLGEARVSAEPAAVEDILARCARLPLALAIASARASARKDVPLRAVADQLARDENVLGQLSAGDPATDIRAVLSWSYQALSPASAGLFRQLAQCPGTEFSREAAASVAAVPVAQIQRLLGELIHDHMLIEHQPGRYCFHDLLRAYAVELTQAHDAENQRLRAGDRLWSHYLHTAFTAAMLINPALNPVDLADPIPGVTPETIATKDQALAWFAAQHPLLISIVTQQPATPQRRIWQLSWALLGYLELRGHRDENAAIQRIALDEARRMRDRIGQAYAVRNLGGVLGTLGQYTDAYKYTELATHEFMTVGLPEAAANAYLNLAWISDLQGDVTLALDHAHHALALHEKAGNRGGQAYARNAIGWAMARLGLFDEALIHAQSALELSTEVGDRRTEAEALRSLGYIHSHTGQPNEASRCFRLAIDILREATDRYQEAETYVLLGDAWDRAGDRTAARSAWSTALAMSEQLPGSDRTTLRAKLDGDRATAIGIG